MITTTRPVPYMVTIESAFETEVWSFRDYFDSITEFARKCIEAKNAVNDSKSWAPYCVTWTWIPANVQYHFSPWDEDNVDEAFEVLDKDFNDALWYAKRDEEE